MNKIANTLDIIQIFAITTIMVITVISSLIYLLIKSNTHIKGEGLIYAVPLIFIVLELACIFSFLIYGICVFMYRVIYVHLPKHSSLISALIFLTFIAFTLEVYIFIRV